MTGRAIVTGCSRGLGACLTRELLSRGWTVLGIARSRPPFSSENLTILEADLSEGPPPLRHIETFCSTPSDRALLINNAGTIHPTGLLQTVDPESLERLVTLNVTVPMALTASFLAALGSQRTGAAAVINISSGAARHPYKGWAPYCTSKAALDMFTRAVALEQGPSGARIVSFSPGVMDTAMQVEIRAMDSTRFPKVDRFRALEADGELAKPEAVARFLLDALDAGNLIQGAVVDYRDLASSS